MAVFFFWRWEINPIKETDKKTTATNSWLKTKQTPKHYFKITNKTKSLLAWNKQPKAKQTKIVNHQNNKTKPNQASFGIFVNHSFLQLFLTGNSEPQQLSFWWAFKSLSPYWCRVETTFLPAGFSCHFIGMQEGRAQCPSPQSQCGCSIVVSVG